jgi:ketosteroid isomerase-like protein
MILTALTGLFLSALPAGQVGRNAAQVADPDSAAILTTVTAFHAALAAGDSAAALALLAPDAVVLESGEMESRDEYAAHHLAVDIEFSRAVPSQRVATLVRHEGAVAWVATTTTARGTFRDRAVASQGAELMVLSRTGAGWRIRAVHWSSRRL